ncbi:histidine--tRNA ligase [Candidatus Pacearchaeota archaeon CG10_big_fil_rev_8_21_14_0_10_35_219]|nr:histidine--tRNA ligase [Candidatus Pacearchaeota archaeon]OIO42611.1 MAG: histidine--tRNA ligase [Candidatus Pacearchaeota archaeon CG1_02_35_32]PIO07581.1 MAG: histidine--tRNA ligase [Candidatus Pacearchaeota archaeon CG10_big_fil_rev_8_21_14_0_10_35_219]PIY81917.1 MAG: histidine--tRNA ligase [Candidatus Pacearchaeota archaeon CG_4_10_14_0_8_um_filter_35_169]PIZ80570.1 MAG: histidine--tRNA ligase [Candidatus Pacearchaeota archaeon CG_4_10_14_0_2_um_filter_35_33]PJA69460.1 MAG: histidine--t
MNFEPTTVKGFQDFFPPESQKRTAVKKVIEKYFRLYGFQPVETPTIEFDELMRSDNLKNKDEAVSERFKLRDRGGRNLGLRYEFTFQLARLLKENPNIKLPFRKYQIGQVFRDEPTSSSRFREFTQCDIDIIGESSQESEAECLACFSDILKKLKIKPDIQVNNRKLLYSIIESVKIADPGRVIRELDKLDKLDEDTIKANLRKIADTNQILTLFKLMEKPLEFFVKNLFDGAEEIMKLQKAGKGYGFKITFNPFLARGLSYYTGNIFEIRVQGQKNSVAGGGRYDKLVGKFLGREIPATGISFGLERLSSLATVKIPKTKVILISLNQDKLTIDLAKKLRKQKTSCIIFFGKPGKALDYANSLKIKYAIFIGEEEVKNKKFKLKDLESGEEKLLSEKQTINKLKSRN